MRPSQSLAQLAMCLSTLESVASAFEWPRLLPDMDALVVRADSTQSASPTATTQSSSPSATGTVSSSATDAGKGSAETTNMNTAAAGISGATATATANNTFPANSPPGGISMKTPNTALQASGLYRISDYITWSWNYTSLLGSPTAIDVLVSCSTASETYTLTANMSFATEVSYVWNTSVQANNVQNPLGNALYTLIVKDSAALITQPPEPGYLGVYTGYTFGLYTGKPYTPYPDWTCPGSCSGAMSLFNNQAVVTAVIMSCLTVISFTWFVSGLGLH